MKSLFIKENRRSGDNHVFCALAFVTHDLQLGSNRMLSQKYTDRFIYANEIGILSL